MKLVSILSIALLGINILAAEDVFPPPEALREFQSSKEKAKDVAKKWGQSEDVFDRKYSVFQVDEVYYRERCFAFDAHNGYHFDVLPGGALIHFQNAAVLGEETHGLLQPTNPVWDEKKAVKIATEFICEMLGEMPKGLAPGHAKYQSRKQIRNNVEGYSEGKWWIQFRRIDLESGYYFDPQEGIQVYIYENRGPFELYVRMPAHFSRVDFTPLPQREIIEPAYEAALKMTSHGQLFDYFEGGHLLKDQAVAHLEIVKPNHFGDSDIYTSTIFDLNARLAWIVWYPWKPNDRTVDPQNPPRGLAVWIDAQSKVILGGDAFAK